MIGNSRLHNLLRNGRTLSDVVAWYEVMDSKSMKDLIIKLVTRDQLFDRGIDSEGNVIGYYSYMTEIISGGEKQLGDHYTLLDSGDMFDSLFVAIFVNEFVIIGDTAKIESQDWYTDKILKLTDENIQKVRGESIPKFRDYLTATLFRTL
jgi:hypothetical protein